LASDPVLRRRVTLEDLKLGASKIPEVQSNRENLNRSSFGDAWWDLLLQRIATLEKSGTRTPEGLRSEFT
jgi:hypothetical protein